MVDRFFLPLQQMWKLRCRLIKIIIWRIQTLEDKLQISQDRKMHPKKGSIYISPVWKKNTHLSQKERKLFTSLYNRICHRSTAEELCWITWLPSAQVLNSAIGLWPRPIIEYSSSHQFSFLSWWAKQHPNIHCTSVLGRLYISNSNLASVLALPANASVWVRCLVVWDG